MKTLIIILSLLTITACSNKSNIIADSDVEFKTYLESNYQYPVAIQFKPATRGPSSFGGASDAPTKCERSEGGNKLLVNKIWWHDVSTPEERVRVLREETERCAL